VFTKVLEAIGRRMEDHNGNAPTLHILLVAKIGIEGDEHVKLRFGHRQKVPVLLS